MRKRQKQLYRSRQFPYILRVYKGKILRAEYYVNRKHEAIFHDEDGFIPELSVYLDGMLLSDSAKAAIARHCGVYDDGTYNHSGNYRSLRFEIVENLVEPTDTSQAVLYFELVERPETRGTLHFRIPRERLIPSLV